METSEPWASPDPYAQQSGSEPQSYDPYRSQGAQPQSPDPYAQEPGSAPQPYDPYAHPGAHPQPQAWERPAPWERPTQPGYGPQPYGSAPYGYPQPGYPQPGYPQPGYGPPGYWQPPQRQPWVVAAPPGTPYHRLARTELHRWWRPLVGTLFLIFTGLVAILGVMLFAVLAYQISTGHAPTGTGVAYFQNATGDLAFELVTLAVLTPVVLLTVWVVGRRPIGSIVSVANRIRWKWLGVCCGLAVGFCATGFAWSYAVAAVFADEAITAPKWAGWDTFLLPAVVIVLLVPFQASAEEFVFRGWFVQAIAGCTLETRTGPVGRALSVVFRTPWPALIISAGLFTSGHGYTGWAMLDTFLFGLLAGWLAVRTGGLEAAIALHVFNNLMAFLLPAAAGQLADSMKQGGAPWYALLSDVVPLGLYGLVVVLLARRLRIQTVSGPVAEPVRA